MAEKKFELTNLATGKKSSAEIKSGTLGPDVLNIANITRDLGVYTFDPGFMATASCESRITFIDGDQGVLLHRGIPIDQLNEFTHAVQYHTMINESLLRFFNGFQYNAHPMAMLSGVVASMAAFYHDSMDIHNPRHREIFAHRIIAKIPTIAAAAYKHSLGQPFIYPRNDLDYCSNLLHMFFAVPCEAYKVDPVAAEALDLLFILHADHEQNASTSTVRLVGSTGANPYACVAAGIAALWGPAHGGANEAVLKMLGEIGDTKNVGKAVERAKDKNSGFRLMGFGHRVYKNFDPRATIIREMCHKVLADLGVNDPLLDVAMALEEVALKDSYFVERKLYPNVDFYSGLIYKALKIPTEMFTVMFALGRMAGWVAHWLEQHLDKETKIGRPRQIYTGAVPRDYQPLSQR